MTNDQSDTPLITLLNEKVHQVQQLEGEKRNLIQQRNSYKLMAEAKDIAIQHLQETFEKYVFR